MAEFTFEWIIELEEKARATAEIKIAIADERVRERAAWLSDARVRFARALAEATAHPTPANVGNAAHWLHVMKIDQRDLDIATELALIARRAALDI